MEKIKVKVGCIKIENNNSPVGEVVEISVDNSIVCSLQGDGFKDLIGAVVEFSNEARKKVDEKQNNLDKNNNNLKKDEKEKKIRLR